MSEAEIDLQLNLYLDGELPDDQKAALEEQLSASPELRERMERLRRASKELQNFFTDSQMIHAASETDRDMVVERIVRESTMEARRSGIAGANKKKPSYILGGSLAIAAIAALFLLIRAWVTSGPEPTQLIEGAKRSMLQEYMEAEVYVPSFVALVREFNPTGSDIIPNTRCRLRTGPQGRFHVFLTDGDDGTPLAHIGFDGKQGYVWRKDDDKAQILSLEEVRKHPIAAAALWSLDSMLNAVNEGAEHPDALELVGRVKDEANKKLWKVRLGGPKTSFRASYWFDNDGKLRRISAGPVQFDMKEGVELGPDDFKLETVLPGMSGKKSSRDL